MSKHQHTDPKIGNYHIQLKAQFQWLWKYAFRKNSIPRPCLFYPASNWISDPKEIINAIRLDDYMGIKSQDEINKDE